MTKHFQTRSNRRGFVLPALLALSGLWATGSVAQAPAGPGTGCPAPVTMQRAGAAPITLRFVGDLVLGNNHLVENIPPEWEKLYFAGVEDYLKSADASVGNLEGVLTRHPKTLKATGSGRAFAFRFPPHYAGLLRQMNFRAVTVANNHSNDFGEIGFADTLKHLRDASVAIAGLKGEYATFEVKGLKVAVVGFGFYPRQDMIQHLESAARLVARARAEAQYVIATFHGGAEGDEAIWHANEAETYLGENRGNAVAFARAAIDAGADVVVGHGPHVLRSIECYKGKPVFHSLGNFVGVGGLSIRGMASLSAIAGVQLGSRGELLGIEFLPVTFTERKVPVPDERQFSAHLVNWLGREARYSGQFLQVPADAAGRAAFDNWVGTLPRAARPR
ncbi:MAG: CapA family protein [Ramlibacter sp.]|jgi:hypothetical protein|nr:CapA family protein [Ramlibacter sp.]